MNVDHIMGEIQQLTKILDVQDTAGVKNVDDHVEM